MPKMKTKSGAKKRFKVSARGKVRAKQAFTSHMMMNKPKSMKRKARGVTNLSKADAQKVLKGWLPYNNKKAKGPAGSKKKGGE